MVNEAIDQALINQSTVTSNTIHNAVVNTLRGVGNLGFKGETYVQHSFIANATTGAVLNSTTPASANTTTAQTTSATMPNASAATSAGSCFKTSGLHRQFMFRPKNAPIYSSISC